MDQILSVHMDFVHEHLKLKFVELRPYPPHELNVVQKTSFYLVGHVLVEDETQEDP